MEGETFSYRRDAEADGGFVDVSLETSIGSRDANMESDVLRRGRWRKPLPHLRGILGINNSLPTERIVSAVMMDDRW